MNVAAIKQIVPYAKFLVRGAQRAEEVSEQGRHGG
jgi:hypothetical protein